MEIPREAGGSFWGYGVPFDFAQGRLSTARDVHFRERHASLRTTEISSDPGIRGMCRASPRAGQPRARPEHAEGPGCPRMSILLRDPATSALAGSRAFAHGLFHLERIQNGGNYVPRFARVHKAAETYCAGDDVSKFGCWQSAQPSRGSL